MNPFLRVIDALNSAHVRYVIVGGFAAFLHGSRRVTVDLDIVVDLQEAEARKAVQALLSLGLQSRLPVDPFLFANATERKRWADEKNMLVFTMFDPTNPGFVVDMFVDSPIGFDQLNMRANEVEIEQRKVRVCSIDDLIEMKKKAGRPQDITDIEALKRIQSFE